MKMFQLKIFNFYNFENLCILHGHVFVMTMVRAKALPVLSKLMPMQG